MKATFGATFAVNSGGVVMWSTVPGAAACAAPEMPLAATSAATPRAVEN